LEANLSLSACPSRKDTKRDSNIGGIASASGHDEFEGNPRRGIFPSPGS
jgi:hypothetical protein